VFVQALSTPNYKRALGLECGSSVKGVWTDGFLAGDPEGCVEKSLEAGLFIGAPSGNLEEGLSTGDFES
jgi:hypothetical protein